MTDMSKYSQNGEKKKTPNLIQTHRHDVFFNPSGGFYCLLGLLISVKFFFLEI